MKIKVEKLLIFYFTSVTIAIYNIPIVGGLNLSIDRLLVLPAFALILYFCNRRIWGLTEAILMLIISSAFSLLFSDGIQLKGILKLLPSYILCLFILHNATKACFHFNLSFSTRILRYHWLIILFFTLYGFYYRYILNEIFFVYPFNSFLGDLSTDEHKINMIRYFRLFFPLSSAPRLGFVAIALLLYHIYIKNLIPKYSWIVTVSLIFVTLLTVSRGPIVALFVTLWIGQLIKAFRENKLKTFFKFHVVLLILLFGSYFLIALIAEDFNSYSRLLLFASSDDSSFEGHLGVRMRVLENLINSDIKTIFFGNGLGHFELKLGTSSAHSSIFTQLYEQGIFGLFTYSVIYSIPIFIGLKTYFKFPSKITLGLFKISLFLFLIHFTYDAITTANLWLYQGLVWGVLLKIKNLYAKDFNYNSNL